MLLAEREPTRDEAMLIAPLAPYEKVRRLVPKDQRKAAAARAEAIADDGIAGKAVNDAIEEIQASVLLATTVVTVSAAVSGNS